LVSSFSRELIDRSGYLQEGFADVYDRYRPGPTAEVLDILAWLARAEQPKLVIDFGSGTGLSTRAWAERADAVIGVEPNPRMIERARAATDEPNVQYVEAYAAETGLPDGGADLVTCFQAFHWMAPQPVLAEAARLLRRGGVFAAVDYDVPPVVEPEVDSAFGTLADSRRSARDRLGVPAGSSSWPKERHLEQIQASGQFWHADELVAHVWSETDAERLIGFARSIGGPRKLFADAPEVETAFERASEIARRVLGDRTCPMLFCYRIRAGFK
jgi:SAM-dependent methyltransferase